MSWRLVRTWKVRCPNCHGRPTRTFKGPWSRTEGPRVVWTCPTCKGSGEVDVQLAREPDHAEITDVRERLLSDEALTAAMGAWPAAHVPHTLRPEDYGGLGDPRLMRACREAEAQNREVAAGVIEAALDAAFSSTEPTEAEGFAPDDGELGCGGTGTCRGCPDCQPPDPATHHTAGEQGGAE